MTYARRFGLALIGTLVLTMQAGIAAAPAYAAATPAGAHGYEMWFVGQIRALDVPHGRIRIARGPTETADAAIVECVIPRRAARKLRVGMDVSAEADTRRVPWRILHLRVLERIPAHAHHLSWE